MNRQTVIFSTAVGILLSISTGVLAVGLIGMSIWNLNLTRQNQELRETAAKLPTASPVSREEAGKLMQGPDANDIDTRSAVQRTEVYGLNMQLFALRQKRINYHFTGFLNSADNEITKEWIKRNSATLWEMMLENSLDLRSEMHGSDKHEVQSVDCKYTYRTEPLGPRAKSILENSVTVAITMKLKQSVVDEERKWPADMRWPLPPRRVTIRFVLDDSNHGSVRDVELQGIKPAKDSFNSLEQMHTDTASLLRFIFNRNGRLRFAYPNWDNNMKRLPWTVED